MGRQPNLYSLAEAVESLQSGSGISVRQVEKEKVLRIEWLNLYNSPALLDDLAFVIADRSNMMGYRPDAIASIETSGAKYGVAVSLRMRVPYFSLHKVEKIIFQDVVQVENRSVTENRAIKLYVDRSVAAHFRKVLLVDDIRRTSSTIDAAVDLLQTCGCELEGCFVVLDFKFAGHPAPRNVSPDRYHPLLVLSQLDDAGRCVLDDGVALKYLGKG